MHSLFVTLVVVWFESFETAPELPAPGSLGTPIAPMM